MCAKKFGSQKQRYRSCCNHFNQEIDNVSFTEIWDASCRRVDIMEFAAIEELKHQMKKIT
ncbi:MAG: hypothetical protein CM15mP111_4650 [Hyphomicrobiales bacterium]|nr:MAG: hypothetical protein CM15mP111_4650 [Hyphomicrobiales bacterium]